MNYAEYEERINSVKNYVELFTVGYSLLSQPIYGGHVGSSSGRQVIVQCAIHAREYVTTLLAVELTKYYATTPFGGGAYFIYNMNPDGVRLVLDGAEFLPCEKQRDFLLSVNGSEDFSRYKANANAVDLNTNFDAKWGGGASNLRCPAPESFIGYYPMSEREVNALAAFTKRISPYATISYHTKGEVIYYGFDGQKEDSLARDEAIAYRLSAVTGYTPILTAQSTGGYKDWCIEKYDIPSFTIEVAPNNATHPVGEEYLPDLFEQNKNVLPTLIQ
ncbi:MAG: hypothetical protein J5765_01970 [Clostridia bacterium]|nr:hypothetical protein [Clostridia bacterium]